MSFPPTQLSLSETCKQVVLVAPVDELTASCACTLALSPFVPLNCRVVVWDPSTCPARKAGDDGPALETCSGTRSGQQKEVAAMEFTKKIGQTENELKRKRYARQGISATHISQFYYGGMSPKAEEVSPMLHRIEVQSGGYGVGRQNGTERTTADAATALVPGGWAAGSSAVESLFVLFLSSQSLGRDATAALAPYEAFLRSIWSAAVPSLPLVASGTSGPASPKRVQCSLLIIADDVFRHAACALVTKIANEVPAVAVDWAVVLVYTHAMDPPALEFGATEVAVRSTGGIRQGGMLPVLCAGYALGVLRYLPVYRSDPATITPVDVTVNAALLGHIFQRYGELPECMECVTDMQYQGSTSAAAPLSSNAAVGDAGEKDGPSPKPTCTTQHRMASFAVAESLVPGEASLVWGMVGEFLMEYYGRFADRIAAAFPLDGVLAVSPVLQFPFSLADVANFGPQPRAAGFVLEGWRAYQQRQHIMERMVGNSDVGEMLRTCVVQLDETISSIAQQVREGAAIAKKRATGARQPVASVTASSFSPASYRLKDFNVTNYHVMLRRLTVHHSLMPYHQCVALSEVDWEAYILTVARAVLEHLARRAAQLPPGASWGSPCAPSAPREINVAEIAGATQPSVAPIQPDASSHCSVSSAPSLSSSATAEPLFVFPEPRRSFTNDLVYQGPERLPPLPSLTRRIFDPLVFVHRAGLAPSGVRGDMTPGLTRQVATSIIAQPHIQRLITALAAQHGVSRKEVEVQAVRILIQCGDNLNHLQCRPTGLMIREFFRRIFGRVNVNAGTFERIHRYLAMPRVAVVFVPLHRSYIDFLILSEVLAIMQFPLPHIVAGDNFLSMGVMASMMRGSGAFFMRRSFSGDPLYTALFKGYVQHMLRKRRPLEFFIEGMRSRTGKTMAPKMGLLKFVCDAFYEPGQQELDDLLIIPVSLSYDELLEATAYAQELLGAPKPKETMMNMLKARSLLDRQHGNINIHVGEAVSLRSIKEHPRRCPLPFQPKCPELELTLSPQTVAAKQLSPLFDTTPRLEQRVGATPAPLLSTIAWHIMFELQRNIVITPASMVAALLECLSPYYTPRRPPPQRIGDTEAADLRQKMAGVPLEPLRQGVDWLRTCLLDRGSQLSYEAAEWSADRVVTLALSNLSRYVHLSGDMARVVYRIDNVVTRVAVNISTNQLIHACVDDALIAVVAQAFGSPVTPHHPPSGGEKMLQCGLRSVKADVLSNQTRLLQQLLSVEFPNYAAAAPLSFDSWLECTITRLQQQQQQHDEASTMPAAGAAYVRGSPLVHVPVTWYYYFLLQLLGPHVEALYVLLVAVITLLKEYPGALLGVAEAIKAVQQASISLYEEQQLQFVVGINKDTLQHYHESLVALSLLQLKRQPGRMDASTSKSLRKTSSTGAVVFTVGAMGEKDALERLEVLSAQMQALRWSATSKAGTLADRTALERRVLAAYRGLTQPSKM